MMVVEHLWSPTGGSQLKKFFFRHSSTGRARDEMKALRDTQVMGVDHKSPAADGAEVDDCGAGLRSDAVEGFKPFSDASDRLAVKKVQAQFAVILSCDAAKGFLETGRFFFGEGGSSYDAKHFHLGSIAHALPASELAFECVENFMRGLCLRP